MLMNDFVFLIHLQCPDRKKAKHDR